MACSEGLLLDELAPKAVELYESPHGNWCLCKVGRVALCGGGWWIFFGVSKNRGIQRKTSRDGEQHPLSFSPEMR